MSKGVEVKKPLNSFFLYRKHIKEEVILKYGIIKNQDVNKKIAELWAKESQETKDKYQELSLQEHIRFKENNPDFDWQPWKRNRNKVGKKRLRKSSASPTISAEEASCPSPESCNSLPNIQSPKFSSVRLTKSYNSLEIYPQTHIRSPSLFYKVSPDVFQATILESDANEMELNMDEYMSEGSIGSPLSINFDF
ncbi:hypothetical protein HDV06_000405 [Boothiomyces sp. JEL0866]|nr:hypothetical protein HDV06_000405 [Boothiomyces sp. JEL0866]